MSTYRVVMNPTIAPHMIIYGFFFFTRVIQCSTPFERTVRISDIVGIVTGVYVKGFKRRKNETSTTHRSNPSQTHFVVLFN